MCPGILSPVIRVDLATWIVIATIVASGPVQAQEPVRLMARPVTITPKFDPEGLANQFEEGAPLPVAMTTAGGGDTWVACAAYSPDGLRLAIGDRPLRPLCTFLGAAPVNENGGLIRIIDVNALRVSRTIGPVKQPRHEYEIMRLAYLRDGRTLVALGKETWPKEGGGRDVGYQLTAWDGDTGQVLRRINLADLDDWKEISRFSRDASTFVARTARGFASGTSRQGNSGSCRRKLRSNPRR